MLLTSLPAFAQTHDCHRVHICSPDAFAFQEYLCFGVSTSFGVFQWLGVEISFWQTLPVLELGWLWLSSARLPMDSHPNLPKPPRSQSRADRLAGSCLKIGILMDAKLGSTSPAHPIHQLPKINPPCSV